MKRRAIVLGAAGVVAAAVAAVICSKNDSPQPAERIQLEPPTKKQSP